MLIKQYEHRLPSDYDMSTIRERGRTRGLLWDHAEGLAFKAFALRERGQHGAHHNAYTSIYLWLNEDEAAKFVPARTLVLLRGRVFSSRSISFCHH